jgi:hypothetical protein
MLRAESYYGNASPCTPGVHLSPGLGYVQLLPLPDCRPKPSEMVIVPTCDLSFARIDTDARTWLAPVARPGVGAALAFDVHPRFHHATTATLR